MKNNEIIEIFGSTEAVESNLFNSYGKSDQQDNHMKNLLVIISTRVNFPTERKIKD